MKVTKSTVPLIYEPDDKPRSQKDAIVYSLQWVMIMFYPVVWGYSVVGKGLDMQGEELSVYMARVVFVIGISTLVQVFAGHRLSMVGGPNIIPSLAIVAAYSAGGKEYALQSFNAYIIAGIIVALIGLTGVISKVSRYWTPLVGGAMVMMVGLTTSASGVGMIAGEGMSAAFFVGILLALICGFISLRAKGMLASIPVMITIVLGYVIFIAMGQFDWELVNLMPVISLPQLFPYGLTMPPVDLIVTMIIVNLFAAINMYGNVQAYSGIVGRQMEPADEKRYFTIFGLVEGVFASIFGVPSTVAYGENLGFVLLTRIASRFFLIVASVIFIVLSFFGKVGGMMAAMPDPVAGAVLLGVACTLIGLGAQTWAGGKKFETREVFIVGFSVFLAFGLNSLPSTFYATVPRLVSTIFQNPVITVIIFVVIMEQIIFREKEEQEAQEANAET